MAELDPNIVFKGYTPLDYQRANDQSNLSQASTTGQNLQNTETQQKIDQTKYDVNFRKTLDDLLAKHTRRAGSPPPAPQQTDAMGNPTGTPGPQSTNPETGRPSLAAGDGDNPTGSGTGVEAASGLPGETPPPSAAPTSPVDKGDGSSRAPADTSSGFVTDMRSLQQELADKGYGAKALAMNQALMEAAVKGLDIQTKQFELLAKQHGQMASLAGAVLQNQVDPNEQDPQKLDAQKSMFLSAARTALQTGLQQGVIDQAHAQPIEAMIAQGWSPQLQAAIKQISDAGMTSEQLHTAVSNQLKDNREAILKGSEVAERNATILTKNLANAGQTVRGAVDQASFDDWYKGQPESVQKETAALYKKGYSPETVDAIASLGQTEEQRSNQVIRQAQNEATNQLRQDNLDIRREIAAKGSASDKADIRSAQTKLLSLQKQEEPLYGEMAQLRTAIATNGRTFVAKNGSPADMNTKTTDPEKQKDLVDDMKDRLAAAQQKAESLINEKYDIVDQHGGQPKMSREDALKNLHTPTPVKTAAAPAATPVTAKPAATPAPAKTPALTVGQSVMVGGKPHKVIGFKNGRPQVQAIAAQ